MIGQSFVFGNIAGGGAVTLVDFLVVAGGGGSTNARAGVLGGGGAGGLRTSYGSTSGGGNTAEAQLEFAAGTTYTITIGAGGYNHAGYGDGRGTGQDSSIVGGDISVVSDGGGFAGYMNYNSFNIPPSSGGSGAGGGFTITNGTANGTAGVTNQGFAGSNPQSGSYYGNTYSWAGHGGGAGGAGLAPNGRLGYTFSGAASGAGIQTTIVSSTNATSSSVGQVVNGNVYYASGGQAPAALATNHSTYIGSGSSTPGASNYYAALGGGGRDFANGTANTGGGAGGHATGGFGSGLAGGSGVVILRIPTSDYSGTTTGSPDVYTEGTDKVLVYSGSGSYTH